MNTEQILAGIARLTALALTDPAVGAALLAVNRVQPLTARHAAIEQLIEQYTPPNGQ